MTRTERHAAGNLHGTITFQLDSSDGDGFLDGLIYGCSDLLDDFLRRISQLESDYSRAMVGL